MSFDSINFIFFFPIVIMLYYILPQRCQRIWLLIASYYFYISWDVKYALVLVVITGVTYILARIVNKQKKKLVLFICITACLLVLIGFKYFTFVINISTAVCTTLGFVIAEKPFSIVVPLGISFYTLQALGYVIDVYGGKVQAEKNFINYALYVSFFPTMSSGPIERSTNLLRQIQKGTDFSYYGVKKGLLMMGYGYFEKLYIANKISGMVNNAYDHSLSMPGAALALAVVLYAIQIYADFSGYSYIAIGAAKVLGFDLKENFKQPYFACSVKEFWKRWHISLSSWLQDYVYIPLGGSRKGRIRTYCNLMITFFISALWHGTGVKYIVWGGLHGIYQIIGKIASDFESKLDIKAKTDRDNKFIKVIKMIITFVMVDFAWIFFSAPSAKSAVSVIYRILTEFQLKETIKNGYYLLGSGEDQFWLLIVGIVIILFTDIIHENNISISDRLKKQSVVFRWMVYLLVALILMFGVVNNYGINASAFLYTQF